MNRSAAWLVSLSLLLVATTVFATTTTVVLSVEGMT
jgi:hypothetical protein